MSARERMIYSDQDVMLEQIAHKLFVEANRHHMLAREAGQAKKPEVEAAHAEIVKTLEKIKLQVRGCQMDPSISGLYIRIEKPAGY